MPSEDGKAAVKEEAEDEKSLGSMVEARKRKNNASLGRVKKQEPQEDEDFEPPVKAATSKTSKLKKEENDDDDDDHKPISKRSFIVKAVKFTGILGPKEVKKKKTKEEGKKGNAVAEQNGRKREKKVYDLPGQKRDAPEERDPLRIFYETLYKQVPGSEMAQFWMMESGLLPKEEAKKVFDKKQKRNQQQKLYSPAKVVNPAKKSTPVKKKASCTPNSSNEKKKQDSEAASKQPKKHKVVDASSENESDDDFLVSRIKKKPKAK